MGKSWDDARWQDRMAVTNRLVLDRVPEAARVARRGLDSWLRAQRCESREDALLVVSELVTNAVVHGRGDPVVVMVYTDDRLRLEIHDDDPRPPVRREPRSSEPGGYGLNIVDRLCEEWGWAPTDDGKLSVGRLPTEGGSGRCRSVEVVTRSNCCAGRCSRCAASAANQRV